MFALLGTNCVCQLCVAPVGILGADLLEFPVNGSPDGSENDSPGDDGGEYDADPLGGSIPWSCLVMSTRCWY